MGGRPGGELGPCRLQPEDSPLGFFPLLLVLLLCQVSAAAEESRAGSGPGERWWGCPRLWTGTCSSKAHTRALGLLLKFRPHLLGLGPGLCTLGDARVAAPWTTL